MCCERLQNSTMEAIQKIPVTNPDRLALLQVIPALVSECPKERKTHTARLLDAPLPPESEAIPAFFRKNPNATDLLEQYGALRDLLR